MYAPWDLIKGFAGLMCFAFQLCKNMKFALSAVRAF